MNLNINKYLYFSQLTRQSIAIIFIHIKIICSFEYYYYYYCKRFLVTEFADNGILICIS